MSDLPSKEVHRSSDFPSHLSKSVDEEVSAPEADEQLKESDESILIGHRKTLSTKGSDGAQCNNKPSQAKQESFSSNEDDGEWNSEAVTKVDVEANSRPSLDDLLVSEFHQFQNSISQHEGPGEGRSRETDGIHRLTQQSMPSSSEPPFSPPSFVQQRKQKTNSGWSADWNALPSYFQSVASPKISTSTAIRGKSVFSETSQTNKPPGLPSSSLAMPPKNFEDDPLSFLTRDEEVLDLDSFPDASLKDGSKKKGKNRKKEVTPQEEVKEKQQKASDKPKETIPRSSEEIKRHVEWLKQQHRFYIRFLSQYMSFDSPVFIKNFSTKLMLHCNVSKNYTGASLNRSDSIELKFSENFFFNSKKTKLPQLWIIRSKDGLIQSCLNTDLILCAKELRHGAQVTLRRKDHSVSENTERFRDMTLLSSRIQSKREEKGDIQVKKKYYDQWKLKLTEELPGKKYARTKYKYICMQDDPELVLTAAKVVYPEEKYFLFLAKNSHRKSQKWAFPNYAGKIKL